MNTLLSYLWPYSQRQLIEQFVRREVQSRYRQSLFGTAWLLLTPLLTLAVYTLVFQHIFTSRWANTESTMLAFALRLFAGLSLFSFVAECLTRAPRQIVGQPNLVKKVVFPLPILAWVQVLSSAVQFGVALIILFIGQWCDAQQMPLGILGAPLIFIPLLYLVLGLSWFLAALGVYLRDVEQIIGLVMSLLLFLTPIFYPSSSLPVRWQAWMQYYPLAYWIESFRQLIFDNQWPNLGHYLVMCVISLLVALGGALFFKRTQEGFADVL